MKNIVNTWYLTCDFCKGHTNNPIIMNLVIEDGNGLVHNLICCPDCLPKEGEDLVVEIEIDSKYNPDEFEDNGFDPKAYIGKIRDTYKDVADHLIPKEILDGVRNSKPKFEDKRQINQNGFTYHYEQERINK